MKKRLNQRQRKFADYMAGSGNQTESAIMAGYSPKRAHVTGSELVRNRMVSEEIIRRREKIEEELGINPYWCAKRYVDLSQAAEESRNFAAARGCLDSLAKLMEWFPKEEKKSEGNEFSIELMLKRIEEEKKEKLS